MRSVILSQWRERRKGGMTLQDLGALTTARARVLNVLETVQSK